MKRTKLLLGFCIFFSICFNGYAQECLVVADALKGKYEGGCEKGKANGQGKAAGTDSYEGMFKDGHPDGQGMYVWKDGHYFIGTFKKGLKEGKGDMYYESASGQDSTITGYWKKDKYVGEYEKPFEVQATSSRIGRLNCRITNKKGNNITFNVSRVGGLATLTGVNTLTGTFYTQYDQKMSNVTVSRFKDVTFPFSAIFSFSSGDTVQILFNEKADYDVEVLIM